MKTGAPPSFGAELWGRRYAIVYLALLVRLVIEIGRWHDPHTGFSSLIDFGDQFAARRVASLSDVPLYTYARSSGYDGQFYAQLAVAGNPLDPELDRALDSAGYRARRALLPALVHLAGLGRPAWIIQAYALANLLCSLILAALLARWWFPPTDLHNLLRWVGTLFGAGMMVSVRDSGIGIAKTDLARVLQPFVQVDNALSRRHEGTGLGLALSKNLTEAMGGTLSFDSTPGRGSVFTIQLPIFKAQ